MATLPATLREEQCPLLDEHLRGNLVEAFNHTVQLLEFCRGLAREPQPEKCERFGLELARLGEEMARPRYFVGFLGPFQAGKSRTFNNLLRTVGKDQPAGVGQGFPTTAVVTRLRRSPSNHNMAKIVFLTIRGYQQKRRFLLERCGFDPELKDDHVILREIDQALGQWERTVRTWQDAAGNSHPVKRRDMEYLALMLNSYRVFGDRIREQPVEEMIRFEERWQYLNHPPDPWHRQSGVVSPLLSHVEMEFVTEVIPATLEMVDLPGYDAHCSIDAFVTDEFLKTLQAALVFCRATDFSAAVETIVAKLKRLLGHDLRGRVWLIITRCDDINIHPQVAGNDRRESVFEQLASFLERTGIPKSQVLFVTNEPRELENRLRDGDFAQALQVALQEAERRWPELPKAWQRLLEEGGVAAVRDLIVHQLSNQISASVARKARQLLPHIREELFELGRYLVEERLSEAMPASLAKWRTILRQVGLKVVSPTQISALAAKVEQDLTAAWGEMHVTSEDLDYVISREGNEGLKEEFLTQVDSLERALRAKLAHEWLDHAYEVALGPLRHAESTDGILALPTVCDAGVAAYLEKCRREDQSLTWLDKRGPSFIRNHPFEGIAPGSDPLFNGENYLDMFDRKIRVLSRQVSLVVCSRVHERIENLLSRLAEFARKLRDADRGIADPALHDRWRLLQQTAASLRERGV